MHPLPADAVLIIKYTIQKSCQGFSLRVFLAERIALRNLGKDFLNLGDQVIRKGLGDSGFDPVAGSSFSLQENEAVDHKKLRDRITLNLRKVSLAAATANRFHHSSFNPFNLFTFS
jgi:hypothetical protein